MEIWKKTKYENYIVSNKGRVMNVNTGKVIGAIGNHGYYKTTIYGNYILTHRLVAETWIPNPNNLPVINHIDRNKLNNDISNLEWVTQSSNIKDTGTGNRHNLPLTDEQIDEVKKLRDDDMSFMKITKFMNDKYNRTTSRQIYTRICK